MKSLWTVTREKRCTNRISLAIYSSTKVVLFYSFLPFSSLLHAAEGEFNHSYTAERKPMQAERRSIPFPSPWRMLLKNILSYSSKFLCHLPSFWEHNSRTPVALFRECGRLRSQFLSTHEILRQRKCLNLETFQHNLELHSTGTNLCSLTLLSLWCCQVFQLITREMLVYESYPKPRSVLEAVTFMLNPAPQENRWLQTSYLPGTNKKSKANWLSDFIEVFICVNAKAICDLLAYFLDRQMSCRLHEVMKVDSFEEMEMGTAAFVYLCKLAHICSSWQWQILPWSVFSIKLFPT